ncbi:type II toxin-antitoxin system ParD family antitoxin [Methylobacterium sp. WL69]|uniref:type II toxin-antitoxin system ParD family antitoxin n=1 Tax=Methylobacterium sp. WL69 TaxID=2603893 RepID=UPI0011C75E05|nr:type II toxin-antitoxin system ParD family antitoxin [Methylobacterium sp. WL69]TXM73143.1 type II toxin-antitoxin system ParD family antitoxin [Methylobacterium sp. WL69]
MSSTPTRCIALTKELEAYLRAQVASGRYASASEVVRSALRQMIDREGTILVPRTEVVGPLPGQKSA